MFSHLLFWSVGMEDIDVWANQVVRALKYEIEKDLKEMQEKELDKYGTRLNELILSGWDDYLHSYSPKQYVRTGKTRQGIQLDRNVKVNRDKSLEISVQFVDSYMVRYDFANGGAKRNVFMAMNDGWGNGNGVFRFDYSPPLDILSKVEREMEHMLPDDIKLKIKWSGGSI